MTIDTYWSPATMLSPMAVKMTAAIRAPADFARCDDRLDQPVEEAGALDDGGEAERAEDEPDRGQHRRHAAAREEVVDGRDAGVGNEAVGHRQVERLDVGRRARPASPTKAVMTCGWVNQAITPAKTALAEDGQERRRAAQRQDDQQHHRQQVEQADVELAGERCLGRRPVERRCPRRHPGGRGWRSLWRR